MNDLEPAIGTRIPAAALIRLARPAQWSKSAFCLLGPFYGLRDLLRTGGDAMAIAQAAIVTAVAFALASSACYVINDIVDREADRLHPRKRTRPIASGQVPVKIAMVYAAALTAGGLASLVLLPEPMRWWTALALIAHVANVLLYSAWLKHVAIADVMSLALGFVLRMMGGCAAIGIEPTVWLLNVTFFLSMFLAFGKRLGERRVLLAAQVGKPLAGGEGLAVAHRKVQKAYSDAFLQMAVVVTGVMTLGTYALYVQSRPEAPVLGFNLLWLTILPATFGLFRAITALDSGLFDDPTELAWKDRAFQLAGALFVALTLGVAIVEDKLPGRHTDPSPNGVAAIATPEQILSARPEPTDRSSI
ncbi:MAG: UbiA family prenyltransferase [Phycisphaerales bacterium]|nr:UbiA family prenyltransferase [Phycisphaerales bacterium]